MNYIIQNTDKIPIFSKIFPFNWYFSYELPNYEFPIFSFNQTPFRNRNFFLITSINFPTNVKRNSEPRSEIPFHGSRVNNL